MVVPPNHRLLTRAARKNAILPHAVV